MAHSKKSKTIFLALLVLAQLIAIVALGINIYKKKSQVLGTVTVSPIKKDAIIFNPDAELKHFYEPMPSNTEKPSDPWLPEPVTYTINQDSLYERYEYTVKKSIGSFRIITLGDSFTYGSGVNTADNYTEKLEDLLNSRCSDNILFEIINLAVGGYDIEYAVERYRLRGQKYEPDLVLWFLKNDDFVVREEYMIPITQKYFTNYLKDPTIESYHEFLKDSYKEFSTYYDLENLIDFSSQALKSIDNYYRGSLLLFTFPFTQNESKKIMEDFANSRDKTFYLEEITDIYKTGKALSDYHPTKEGHEIIANNLFDYLSKNNLIPCDQSF